MYYSIGPSSSSSPSSPLLDCISLCNLLLVSYSYWSSFILSVVTGAAAASSGLGVWLVGILDPPSEITLSILEEPI